MPLTPKQENFALTYVETGNASEAYRRAYNAENMKPESVWRKAAELMDNGKVTARIAEIQAPAVQKAQASAEWIIAKAVEVVEAGLAASPVRDRGGNVIMVETEGGEMVPAGWDAFNLAAVNGALKLLSTRFSEFSEKHEHSGDVRLRVEALSVVAQMAPEQLRELAERARA